MSTTPPPTSLCLTADGESEDVQTVPVIVAVLLIFNCIGIIAVCVVIIFETRTILKYHRVKETPPKLVLTREYLEKLRPPRRAPAIDPNTIPSIPSIPSAADATGAAPGGGAGAQAGGGGTAESNEKPKTNQAEPQLEKTQEQQKTEDKKK